MSEPPMDYLSISHSQIWNPKMKTKTQTPIYDQVKKADEAAYNSGILHGRQQMLNEIIEILENYKKDDLPWFSAMDKIKNLTILKPKGKRANGTTR